MQLLKNHFSMYARLPREIYVLAFGKIMTSMGALIWPMLTLIMSEKLKLSGQTIGLYMMIFSLLMVPGNLIGGKLADKYNKKHIIILFDLIGNSLYFICALLPITMNTLYLMAAASVLQQMEHPSYDALIADLTHYEDRERAYSLNYLAMNIGLVLAPTIGGLLFNHYLNLAFLINGLADLSSTLLILFLIKNLKVAAEEDQKVNDYEKGAAGSMLRVLLDRKILLLFFGLIGMSTLIYNQFNFLMPLHMEAAFSGSGAFKFGILTSINALVVVGGTPFLTQKLFLVAEAKVMLMSQFFQSLGLACFIFLNHYFIVAIIGIILFTIGEILAAISRIPYLTKRIPATHRGRILGLMNIFMGLIGTLSNYFVGMLIDHYSFSFVWTLVALLGVVLLVFYSLYARLDRKCYPDFYSL